MGRRGRSRNRWAPSAHLTGIETDSSALKLGAPTAGARAHESVRAAGMSAGGVSLRRASTRRSGEGCLRTCSGTRRTSRRSTTSCSTSAARPRRSSVTSADRYIQHNPLVADGKDAFIAYFERKTRIIPRQAGRIRPGLRRGGPRHPALPPGVARLAPLWAGIDIFRLDEGGKIVEHWDVLQTGPRHSAGQSEHVMF